jgi:NADPH-dependent curcumin reductase CurA
MPPTTNRLLVLSERPHGETDAVFELREAPIPSLADGEVLVRTIYVSIDPTMRGWLIDRPSYVPPVQLGEVMRAGGCGEVVDSANAAFKPGDLIQGLTGWQEYAVLGANPLVSPQPVPPGLPLPLAMSVFNATGMTAYFGMLDVARPNAGETVVVSGAAGATGSVAGQIAKIQGCRVVGLAGTDEKCAWVRDDLGFDDCINYRTEDVDAALRRACPDGVDVYFDNVGGEILDIVLGMINLNARVALCGGISSGYRDAPPPPGPRNLMNLVGMRARMEGFLIIDYFDRFPEAAAVMAGWMAEGRLKSREHIVQGLENAPDALRMLFEGGNTGKLLVQVGPEPGA